LLFILFHTYIVAPQNPISFLVMNQTPEQLARDEIDKQLGACGWKVQSKKQINLAASLGVAVREYQTDIGPANYVLLVIKSR